jgi:tetratricopeptide (TPR) repeat protein
MDTYYTIEEKYLQAVEELNYGETPKSLHLLNDIIQADPLYARAHYQLGLIYYYDIQDYQTAGYHLKLCAGLEPSFPDVYIPYLDLLVFLNMENQIDAVSKKALEVPGVDHAEIYNLLGLFAEKNADWLKATQWYRKALLAASEKKQVAEMEEHLERIALKIKSTRMYVYELSE